MNLSEAEKRMIYQVEGTSQGAALNEIYMTWRYAPDKAMKDTDGRPFEKAPSSLR